MSPREDNQVGEESEEVIKELKDVGQQLALAFNPEVFVLAAGADDGTLRVFKWPSMNTLLNESQAHSLVKSLTFRCLVSVSFDSRFRLTVIAQKDEKRGINLWVAALLLVLIYVISYYFMVAKGLIYR